MKLSLEEIQEVLSKKVKDTQVFYSQRPRTGYAGKERGVRGS